MKVSVRGKNLFFDVEGAALNFVGADPIQKPTLILIHGSPGSSDHSVFKPMFSSLRDIAQVIYLDLSGSGRSDDPIDGVYSLENWADDIVEFCDALGVIKPIVLGNSAGGMVTSVYAIRHPNHPAGVVLSSTQAKLSTDRCFAMFAKLGGQIAVEAAKAALIDCGDLASFAQYATICLPLYNPIKQKRARTSIFRRSCFESFHSLRGVWQTMNFLDELSQITCPTLVLGGDQDPVTPIEDSIDIVSRLDSRISHFERFENAGHGVWLDQPERAFSVLRDFVKKCDPASAR